VSDEESKETSEEPQPEQPQGEDTASAGPVDEEASPSSQAAGEDAPSPPPTDDAPGEEPQDEDAAEEAPPVDDTQEEAPEEASADPGREAEESAVDGEAESPSEEESQPDSSATRGGDGSPKGSKEKKDVIPGADLEPIAVERADERPLSTEERARREAEEEERAQREAELAGDGEEKEDSSATSRAPAKLESGSSFQATGKRKRAIARVTLMPGGGKFEINGRSLEEFFPRPLHQTMARQPLSTSGYETSVDVRVRVHGGGIGGQAGAVRHGISRALTEIDPELRGELKRRGFLTRDARVKERRKAGLKKARKRPQFSKR